MINIRKFHAHDTDELIKLFQDCVRTVCTNEYDSEQINAWAPENIDSIAWQKRLTQSFTVVAVHENTLIGFGSLTDSCEIDMLYVHWKWQKRGIARHLLSSLEEEAKAKGITKLTSDVSLTARPFFITAGYSIDREYTKTARGVLFKNALMTKNLGPR